jgi:hypothetical protein
MAYSILEFTLIDHEHATTRTISSGFCQLSRRFDFLQLAVYTHPSERRM